MENNALDIPQIASDTVYKTTDCTAFPGKVTEHFTTFNSYHNSLPVRVRVINRSGTSTIIPPNSLRGKKGEFYINSAFLIPREVKFDSAYLLNGTATLYPERKVMAEEKEKEFNPFNDYKTVNIVYSFTMSRLMAHGGIIYHPETDTVIAVIDEVNKALDENVNIVHPFSHEGRILYSKETINRSLDARKYNDFLFTIRVVDNIGNYGKRFTLINGRVYSISPVKDTQVREGIYVTCSFPVEGDYESKGVDEQFFPLGEEADNHLGLWRSFHQALITKERLVSMELELKELKMQSNAQEQKYTEAKLRMQAEINELEGLRSKQKERNALSTEIYKSQSEFLKHLPTIITAVGTIIVVALKVADSAGGGGSSKK